MREHFATEQWLPFSPEIVFAFFANPANLPRLMPDWQRTRIDEITMCSPPTRPESTPAFPGVAAGDGTTLLITARPFPFSPVRVAWLALIEGFRWNEGFCDVQLHGPFAYWRHCHSIADAERGGRRGTVVRDEVTYSLPLRPVSRIGFPAMQASLRAAFSFRHARAAELVPEFALSAGSTA